MTIDGTSSAADSNQLALWPPRLNPATNLSIQSKTLYQAPSANETILFLRTTILVNKWNHINNNPHLTIIHAFKFYRDNGLTVSIYKTTSGIKILIEPVLVSEDMLPGSLQCY